MNTSIKTVLIVEDDLGISTSLRELLELDGYNVLSALNGVEALQILKKSTRPFLILLDLMMPVMDGFQFRQLQLADSSIKDIPVVVMSADCHNSEKIALTTANEYIKKPMDIHFLLDTVGRFASH